MLPSLREDIRKHISKNNKALTKQIFFLCCTQGIWATIVFRFGYWTHHYCKIPIFRELLKIFSFFLFKMIEIIAGISIPFSVEIGKGLYLGHFGGPIINGSAKIGKNCSLGIGTVIGTKGLGDKGVPIIGDNVYIGAGAKILGGIKIGNNVKIGANAVVITDIPDHATAVGIPAKIVKIKDKNVSNN